MDHAKEVHDFIVSNFLFGEGGSLQDDTSFLDSGIIDSTGMLEMIVFVENTWGVRVEPEEMVPENLDSVNRVVQFVKRKLASAPA